MASFEDYRPKTKAQNFAPVGAILFRFQNFQNFVNDPLPIEPWKHDFLENK